MPEEGVVSAVEGGAEYACLGDVLYVCEPAISGCCDCEVSSLSQGGEGADGEGNAEHL